MNRLAFILSCVLAIKVFAWMESAAKLSANVFHIRVVDVQGRQFSLTFGTDVNATDGFDLSLGEVPIPPPPPPGNSDLRFVDREAFRRTPGDGSYVDLRRFHSRSQVDTFLIRVQVANDAYPVRFFWDPAPKSFCDSMVVELGTIHGIERLNMMAGIAFTISEDDFTTIRIVKHGAAQ